MTRWVKRIVVFTAVACTFIVFVALVPFCLATREAFLLPPGYEGPVLVVWDHPAGGSLRWASWNTVAYYFDQTGMLHLRDSRPLGSFRMTLVSFYYLHPDGSWESIPNSMNDIWRAGENTVAYAGQIGGAHMRDGTKLTWTFYCIGDPAPGNTCEAYRRNLLKTGLSSLGAQTTWPWQSEPQQKAP